MKIYKDQLLHNVLVTYKIDGVQGITDGKNWVSRANKPLYNLPVMKPGRYEIYYGNWKSSITACRTKESVPIEPHHLYSLDDPIDKRLILSHVKTFTKGLASKLLKQALDGGYEGLVVYSDIPYKIKPVLTFDVEVIGIQEGTGKYVGMMGALVTPMGKVGTGFTDIERTELMAIPIGTIIEVACMELTEDKKFRHPRFIRLREDKQ